jgi:hypothetical protein
MCSSDDPSAMELTHFDSDMIVQILSFCDVSDLLQVLASAKFVQPSVVCSLSTRTSLSISCLRKTTPNKINKDPRQQSAVVRLIKFLQHINVLKQIEFAGLRNLSGHEWLPCLKDQVALQSLNLSGCSSLEPELLRDYLIHCLASLRHLNLHGCIRVGGNEVMAIGRYQRDLQSLSLGGCSQTIKSPHITYLLHHLRQLKHLDLQALKHITDPLLQTLPESICSIDFSSCERLRLGRQEWLEVLQMHRNHQSWNTAPLSRHRLQYIILDALGSPRRGLYPCTLTYFALGRCLREVHLAGCEQVLDWEIEVLAEACGQTLTVFQMRATRIGNDALIALATYCTVLAECDVSACFQVSDEGIVALCQNESSFRDETNPKRLCRRSTLRSLKIGSLPLLTNMAVSAIARLEALLVLDIRDCPQVTSTVLCQTILQLPQIIDVNAKGIADGHVSFSRLLRQSIGIPIGLKFVNQRPVSSSSSNSTQHYSCCSVRNRSQRLDAAVPLQYMYHCIDCGLLPSLSRGICACCVTKCHKEHRTFLGSWTRFYCDCPFGIADNQCTAMFELWPAPTLKQ